MTETHKLNLAEALSARFSDSPDVHDAPDAAALLTSMAARGSCRAYRETPIPDVWLDLLSAVALSSPTKSDLQQRDIIMLRSVESRAGLAALVSGQEWIARAPMIAVFCGNNRRQRLLHEWRGVPFANDHLDAVINATGDAAIALGAFVTAAEALGLGCCPISGIRNDARAVSQLLNLPDHVFPFAGLAFGFPMEPAPVSKRLPLSATYHTDSYEDRHLEDVVETYDDERLRAQPYAQQRLTNVFGEAERYTWSEDKIRQYSQPERADFGAFLAEKGFRLD